MQKIDLNFEYPEELVATERAISSRVLWAKPAPSAYEWSEKSVAELIDQFEAGDVLVLNDTKVLKRRLFTASGLEILFLKPVVGDAIEQGRLATDWEVLCPSSRWKRNTREILPEGIELEIIQRGRPQVVRAFRGNEPVQLLDQYFERHGEMPLPPYIQKARGERHNRQQDDRQYQTAWAAQPGSLAAPTASLHFSADHLELLRARGVQVLTITLHVGLGTFLPITVDDLNEHQMHAEWIEVQESVWSTIEQCRRSGHRVWALGTTVTRALESVALGLIEKSPKSIDGEARYFGETQIFIKPPFDFKVVDVLMTNFHQPESTLLALVAAFVDGVTGNGLNDVKRAYSWAIENKFRLFSYGDLSVWNKR